MSDLTATQCNSCDNGGNGCGCWWIIILLLLFSNCGNNSCGCGNNGSLFNMGNNGDGCCCWWIIILLLFCCGGCGCN